MSLTAPPTPTHTGGADPGPDGGVVELLRRAGAMIDSMWHQALAESGQHQAVQLAEASQGVHRALIALSALERAALGSSVS